MPPRDGGAPRLCRPADEPGAPRAILLHGLAGRADVWRPFLDRAPEGWEWWDVELPWAGMADPAWAHRGDPVELLAAVLDGRRFDLIVAHSFAANLVTEAGSRGWFRELPAVLVSPFYRSRADEFDWSSISYYLNEFHRTFLEAMALGETARFPANYRTWMAHRLRDWVGPYGWMRFFDTYLRSPLADLSTTTAARLIVVGEQDIAARPEDGRALAAALPDGRLARLPGCGHFPMAQDADGFSRAVVDFLTTLPSERRRHEPEPSMELM